MAPPPNITTDLLKHLGVSLLWSWDIGVWGDPEDELHVWADRPTIGKVLSFFDKNPQEFRVRVFEGPPPPF